MTAEDTATSEGLLLVLSGPSGVGKTTIAHRVREQFDGIFSVSATTRPRSDGETNGVDYFFVTQPDFDAMLERGEFLEHAEVFGTHAYGTPAAAVNASLSEGRLVILDIDVQGAIKVRAALPEAFMIFIEPPSPEDLRQRLEQRAREDAEAIDRRIAEAQREIDLAHSSGVYDVFVVNDDLDTATRDACALVERRRHARRPARR